MLATDGTAGAASPLVPVLVVIGVLLVTAALALLIIRSRDSRPRQRIRAGSDLRGDEPGPRPQPRSPGRSRGMSRLRGTAGKTVHQPPSRQGPRQRREPWLKGLVLLYGPWFSTVCHGYCGPEDDDRFTVRAATLRGLRHRYDATPGQDALGVVWNARRRSLFAVVADGLGSLPRSGDAARAAVHEALRAARRLEHNDDPVLILVAAGDAVQRFNDQSEEKGTATMVVAEIRRDGPDADVATWGVGDSEAWLMRGARWDAMHHERVPQKENVTRHLPSDEAKRTRRRVPAGAVVVLATDGFAGALGQGSPLADRLAERWQRPPEPLDFLADVDFTDDHFTDDRAAVAVWIR